VHHIYPWGEGAEEGKPVYSFIAIEPVAQSSDVHLVGAGAGHRGGRLVTTRCQKPSDKSKPPAPHGYKELGFVMDQAPRIPGGPCELLPEAASRELHSSNNKIDLVLT